MKHITTLLPIISILSIALLAGCTSAERSTNTNATGEVNTNAKVVVANTNSDSNTNEAENTNEVVDENTSAEGGSASGGNTNSDVEADEIDTSDWLTYTNEEYGFSFQYPEEWVLEERQVDLAESETASVLTLRTSINTPGALSMSISVSKKSLNDIVDSVRQDDKEISPVVFEDTLNIDGNEVIFIKKKGIDIQPFYYFVSLNNDTILRIEFFNNYSDVISTLNFE